MRQPFTEQEILERVKACLERAGREDPRTGFRRMVEMGLIDEEGRLRREPSEQGVAQAGVTEP